MTLCKVGCFKDSSDRALPDLLYSGREKPNSINWEKYELYLKKYVTLRYTHFINIDRVRFLCSDMMTVQVNVSDTSDQSQELTPIRTRSFLSVCLMNWPATFGCFCLARTKLDNYHCVRTHCVGLTLLNCYPTFLLRKKELEQARQPYLFCARIFFSYALRKFVSWAQWFKAGLS